MSAELDSKGLEAASETYLNFPSHHVEGVGAVVSHNKAMEACIRAYLNASGLQAKVDGQRHELDMLRGDFNDCNAERARWKAERDALAAEVAVLREAVEYAHSQGFDWPSDPFAALSNQSTASLPTEGQEPHEFQQNGPGIIGSDICTVCGLERGDHPVPAEGQGERGEAERDGLINLLEGSLARVDADNGIWVPIDYITSAISALRSATAQPQPLEGAVKGAVKRLKENLDSFDAEVDSQLEQDGERADLWTEIDVNVEDIRIVLSALSAQTKTVKVSDIIHQIALWSDDEGLELSMGQGEDLARRIRSAVSAPVGNGWQPIETAPKDGTRVLIWVVHPNAQYCADPVKDGWAAAYEAHWIDHNGGGWTWHGMLGEVTRWQPLPAAPYQGDGR